MSVTCRAPAKINPVLRVLGRGEDGFHELVSVKLALELAGEVTVERIEPGAGIEVRVEGSLATSDIPSDASNLAARAALAVLAQLGRDDALRVTLNKRVPSRAGLGGGSSDAAAAALATARLLGASTVDSLELEPGLDAALAGALAAIGTDCAFFHAARREGAAVATGRGTDIAPVTCESRWWLSLVTPDVDCSTPMVYGSLGLERGTPRTLHGDGLLADSPEARLDAARAMLASGADRARGALVNDLEPAALRAYPELGAWFELVRDAGLGPMLLAGSGASLFGIHDHEADARDAVERLTRAAAEAGRVPRFATVTRVAGARGGARGVTRGGAR